MPLSEFLTTDAGKVVHRSRASLTKTYYAQAWALIVFLRHGPVREYATGFGNLLQDVRAGRLARRARAARIASSNPSGMSFGESVFRAYFGRDLDQAERRFRSFARDLAGF